VPFIIADGELASDGCDATSEIVVELDKAFQRNLENLNEIYAKICISHLARLVNF
jgi:hypothetical protein